MSSAKIIKLLSNTTSSQILSDFKPLSKLPADYLLRSTFVSYLCSMEFLVKKSSAILDTMKKTLNPMLCKKLLKPTIYKQFAVESDPYEVSCVAESMKLNNLSPLLMVSLEEPVLKNAIILSNELHQLYERNCTQLLNCLDYTYLFNIDIPIMQLKLTGVMPQNVIQTLSVLYNKEKLTDGNFIPSKLINSIATLLQNGHFDLHLQTLLADSDLNNNEKAFFTEYLVEGMKLLKIICDSADRLNIRLLVDAEYSEINDGLSCIALAMACNYNHEQCRVANTYQCYLRGADQRVSGELNFIRDSGLHFGSKIVRGAYLLWESNLAKERGIQSAVLDSYESTSLMYSTVADYLLSAISEENKVFVLFATHNRNSIHHILRRLSQITIANRDSVSFGQLYGLADSVSLNLVNSNELDASPYRVYKSIAVGSVMETLPYLVRRAADNCDIFSASNIERKLLLKALKYKLVGTL